MSFFARYKNPNTYYNTNLSKYVIDTANKIKDSNKNIKAIRNDITIQEPYECHKCDCDFSIVPIFSMFSFLAGYYLAKYNN
jgi:hypothetical protein